MADVGTRRTIAGWSPLRQATRRTIIGWSPLRQATRRTIAGWSPLRQATRRWWVLGAIVLAMLAIGLDVTVLSVALPTLAGTLRASTVQLQWFVAAYTLVLAAALLPCGLLGDRYGRRRMLLVALTIFGLGSVACAYAGSADAFI